MTPKRLVPCPLPLLLLATICAALSPAAVSQQQRECNKVHVRYQMDACSALGCVGKKFEGLDVCQSGNCDNGYGKVQFTDGLYLGNFDKAHPSGLGALTTAAGTLRGNFVNGCLTGDTYATLTHYGSGWTPNPNSTYTWRGNYDEFAHRSSGTWTVAWKFNDGTTDSQKMYDGPWENPPSAATQALVAAAEQQLAQRMAGRNTQRTAAAVTVSNTPPGAPPATYTPPPAKETEPALTCQPRPLDWAYNHSAILHDGNIDEVASTALAGGVPCLRQAFESGNSTHRAAMELGRLYLDGWAVPKDVSLGRDLMAYGNGYGSKPTLPAFTPYVQAEHLAACTPRVTDLESEMMERFLSVPYEKRDRAIADYTHDEGTQRSAAALACLRAAYRNPGTRKDAAKQLAILYRYGWGVKLSQDTYEQFAAVAQGSMEGFSGDKEK